MKSTLSKQSQENADTLDKQNSNSEELIERTEIKDSPFVVTTVGVGSFVTMGKYRLTEVFDRKEEAIQNAELITWNRLIQVIILLNEELKDK